MKSIFGLFITVLFVLHGALHEAVANSDTGYRPDFDAVLDEPAEIKALREKYHVEGQAPCVDCLNNDGSNQNLKDLQKLGKKMTGKAQGECYSCGMDAAEYMGSDKLMATQDKWSAYPWISGYSNSRQVKNTIGYATTHYRDIVSGGYCWRGVKNSILNGGLVSTYINGNPVFPETKSSVRSKKKVGKNAIEGLQDQGFVNLLDSKKYPDISKLIRSPADAPKGAILVYKGGYNGGHVEIKTDSGTKGTYISDFRIKTSVLGSPLAGRASKNYQLVGVMIKPADQL